MVHAAPGAAGLRGAGIQNGNEELQARELSGRTNLWYQRRDDPLGHPVPLAEAPAELQRFVVYVDPRETKVLDGDRLQIDFASHKLGGSIEPRVRRQFVDRAFDHKPARTVLIGKGGLDINRLERPQEFADDQTCDLFEERQPKLVTYGRTYIAADETFDFETFKGGDLIIEDYKGEPVPTGNIRSPTGIPIISSTKGGRWSATRTPNEPPRLPSSARPLP